MNSHVDLSTSRETSPARLEPLSIVLFGPPGSGKSSVGRELASRLGREFLDTDDLVEKRTGMSPAELITKRGEADLRRKEHEVCSDLAGRTGLVIATGGGTLLDRSNQRALETAGVVVFLDSDLTSLRVRLETSPERPLAGPFASGLEGLLASRADVYQAFPLRVDTSNIGVVAAAERVLGALDGGLPFQRQIAQTPPYLLRLGSGTLAHLVDELEAFRRDGQLAVVTDTNVADLYAAPVARQLDAALIVVPAGEETKSLTGANTLYSAFLEHGMDRNSTVVAMGGGVVTDLAGFAASTFMRGVRWVAVPTTVLSMVDASLGGKVAVNLPQAKNLVGAFHPPSAIYADVDTLDSLPARDFRSGSAEIVKAAVIGDAELFGWMEDPTGGPTQRWLERAVSVKADIVEQDPLDEGTRQVLNFGHTLGHAVESASGYRLSHGESVSIGMVMEAHLAERMRIAEAGVANRIAAVLSRLGLPTNLDQIDTERILKALAHDKKRKSGRATYALPTGIGSVRFGLTVPDEDLITVLEPQGEMF